MQSRPRTNNFNAKLRTEERLLLEMIAKHERIPMTTVVEKLIREEAKRLRITVQEV